MFIETVIYDTPHQAGTYTRNELINVSSIVKISPVVGMNGATNECFIYLRYSDHTYVRSADSYDTLKLKLKNCRLLC